MSAPVGDERRRARQQLAAGILDGTLRPEQRAGLTHLLYLVDALADIGGSSALSTPGARLEFLAKKYAELLAITLGTTKRPPPGAGGEGPFRVPSYDA